MSRACSMTSVRPLSCSEDSSEGSWNTKTVTTSVAAAGGERGALRAGRAPGGVPAPCPPCPAQGGPGARLTQQEQRGAVVLGVADDVLQRGGQRAVHHCGDTERSAPPPLSPPLSLCPPLPSFGDTGEHAPCRMPSEKAGSWMAFLRKFSMDLSKAARWGMHCTPGGGTERGE